LGASLQVTEVAAAEEPSTLSIGLRVAQVTIKDGAQKSQTNTMKERTIQNNAVKTNNTYKPDRTIQKTNNTYKPDTQLQSTSDKWQLPKVPYNQNLKK